MCSIYGNNGYEKMKNTQSTQSYKEPESTREFEF